MPIALPNAMSFFARRRFRPRWVPTLAMVEKPTSEIETCVRSSTTCLLGNLAMRHKTFLDWDEKNWTVKQESIRPYLKARYRKPWKLEV